MALDAIGPKSAVSIEIVGARFWQKSDQKALVQDGNVIVTEPDWSLFDIKPDQPRGLTLEDALKLLFKKALSDIDPKEIIEYIKTIPGISWQKAQLVAIALAWAKDIALYLQEERLATRVSVCNVMQLLVRGKHHLARHDKRVHLKHSRPVREDLGKKVAAVGADEKLVIPGFLYALATNDNFTRNGCPATGEELAVLISQIASNQGLAATILGANGKNMPQEQIQSVRKRLATVVDDLAA